MNIERVRLAYFSPTATSKRIVQAVGEGCGVPEVVENELTYPGFADAPKSAPGELTVIGVPVYAGRVPVLAAERLRGVRGSSSPAAIIVVYGNRAYEDALVELRDIAVGNGFRVVAAAAFIGEHSFSTAEMPIGVGRPDEQDLATARSFGRDVIHAAASMHEDPGPAVAVPGTAPYRDGAKNLPFTPVVDHETCIRCGTCVDRCPSGAVSRGVRISMDADSCILCAACLKNCPESAISLASTPVAERMKMLAENCRKRKQPELFF